jgi:hypothetical protein
MERSAAGVGGRRGDVRFAVLTAVALLATHALAFFLHEYAHAVTAWLLAFKADPLGLHYGRLDVANVLLQQEIDENVDYGPIFASGHGLAAAAIALAGPWVGNGLLYLVCALVLTRKMARMRPAVVLVLFWLAVMAAGNLWSYAPVRTIAAHGDMAPAARGLGLSAWGLFPFVVLPTLLVGWDLFGRLLPRVRARACGGDIARGAFVAALACFVYFGFFGMPAIGGGYGDVSAMFSILSVLVLVPVVLMMTLRPGRKARTADGGRGAGRSARKHSRAGVPTPPRAA